MTLTRITRSETETREVAAALARRLRPGDVIALEGPLGAGKTCFVRGLAEGLGIDPREVSSPTFILCQEYEATDAPPLVHVDAYRLTHASEAEGIGLEEIIEAGDALVAIEWADRLEPFLPEHRVRVSIVHAEGGARRITITAPETTEEQSLPPSNPGNAIASQASPEPAATSALTCPICGKPARADDDTYPFCSRRCRLVDLGVWLGEGYSLGRPLQEDDEL